MIVALTAKSDALDALPRSETEPSASFKVFTRKDRVYLLQETPSRNQILEINGLDSEYASFLISGKSSLALGMNNTLHSFTPIDPLFWLLTEEHLVQQHSWQPLDQIQTSFEDHLSLCIDEKQLSLLFSRMEMDEDQIFYKFKVEKALEWLERKRQAVYDTLLAMSKEDHERHQSTWGKEGAFSESFCLSGDQIDQSATARDTVFQPNEAELKSQSIQIVCEYLDESWRKKYLEHLQVSDLVLQNEASRKRKSDSIESGQSIGMPAPRVSTDWTNTMNEKKEKTAAPKLSLKQRQLQKTNIKGMSTLNSFFSKK